MRSRLLVILSLLPILTQAQYSENFGTANKGVEGTCTGSAHSTCPTYDVTGIDWSITGDASSLGMGDMFKTTGGVLRAEDIDAEFCWISPTLDIDIGGNVSISIDLVWAFYDDFSDYVDLEYSIDGGSFVQVPNYTSGLGTDHTVDGGVTGGGEDAGSETITVSGLSGNTLDFRVCFDHNSVSEATTLDNISVPEAGVTIASLPVTWGGFGVEQQGGSVKIQWSTLTEVNNQGFEIFRSQDNESWEKIGSIDGMGFSQIPQSYTFTDLEPIIGKNQYRLKQIDFNGLATLSETMELEVIPKSFQIQKSGPNPTTGPFSMDIHVPEFGAVQFQIKDLKGRTIQQFSTYKNAGLQHVDLNLGSLNPGVYLLIAQYWNTEERIMFVKN